MPALLILQSCARRIGPLRWGCICLQVRYHCVAYVRIPHGILRIARGQAAALSYSVEVWEERADPTVDFERGGQVASVVSRSRRKTNPLQVWQGQLTMPVLVRPQPFCSGRGRGPVTNFVLPRHTASYPCSNGPSLRGVIRSLQNYCTIPNFPSSCPSPNQPPSITCPFPGGRFLRLVPATAYSFFSIARLRTMYAAIIASRYFQQMVKSIACTPFERIFVPRPRKKRA